MKVLPGTLGVTGILTSPLILHVTRILEYPIMRNDPSPSTAIPHSRFLSPVMLATVDGCSRPGGMVSTKGSAPSKGRFSSDGRTSHDSVCIKPGGDTCCSRRDRFRCETYSSRLADIQR